MSTNQIFALPNLPSGTDPQLVAAFASLIDQLNAFSRVSGGGVSENTLRGIIGDIGGGGSTPGGGGEIDYDVPPEITGLRTLSGQGAIVLMYDRQTYPSFSYAEIWRNQTGNLDGTQQKIGTAGSFIYTDLLPNEPAGKEYYYWVKGVNNFTIPVKGPFNAVAGTYGIVSAGTAANIGPGKLPATSIIDLGDGISLIPTADGEIAVGDSVMIDGTGDGLINLGNNLVLSGAADGTILMGNGLVLDAAADGKIDAGTGISMNGAGAGTMSFGTGVDITGESDGAINVGGDIVLSGIGDGYIDLGSGAVTLSGQGSIILAAPGGLIGHDYVIMTNGEIQYMVWDGTQHVVWKALQQIYSGSANSGDVVSIGPSGSPIYFKNEPRIIVSILNLKSYDASYPNQDQQWEVSAEFLREDPVGSGHWKFNAVCALTLGGAVGTILIGWTGNNNVDNSWINAAGPIYSTETNCIKITPVVAGRSSEFSHESGGTNYFKRKRMVWRTRYSTSSSLSSPLFSPTRSKDLGAQFNNVTDTVAISGLAPNKWYFRTEYYFEDTGAVFPSGGKIYDAWSTAQQKSSGVALSHAEADQPYSSDSDNASLGVAAYNPPSQWEVYESVQFSAKVAYEMRAGTSAIGGYDTGSAHVEGMGINETTESKVISGDINNPQTITWSRPTPVASSYAVSSSVDLSNSATVLHSAYAKISIKDIVGIVKIRHVLQVSTTPSNHAELTRVNFELSGASLLSPGSLTYTAIGQ